MKMNIARKTWPQIFLVFAIIWWGLDMGATDPQLNLLGTGCSQYKAEQVSEFLRNVNTTLSELRAQLSSNKSFATAQQATGLAPVYAMVQCRKYLSTVDCLKCFDAASYLIRNCSSANGARVTFDGCFLRYESNTFYDQSTQEGHFGACGNQTAAQANAYEEGVRSLFTDLQTATPKINGFFAATKREIIGTGVTVYGVAQCVETIDKKGCKDCLQVAYADLEKCFSNTEGRATDIGCFARFSDTPFFSDNQTIDLIPFLKNGSSTKKKAIIGGVTAGFGVLLLSLGMWFKLSRKPTTAHKDGILAATELQGPVNYRYKDLKSATKNFSEECKLGEGGFGEVYKGVLRNGKIVAVKKLSIGKSHRAKTEFESEVKIISNVHHRNLVRLLGCCSQGPELLLVYEFMEKSSLDKFLFGASQGSLNWKQRFDIIIGTARGLAYLHEDFHLCIIHRDIKTSNILLDDDFQPKIADFGLARLLPESQSHLSTKFAGTLGYTAPEYAIYGQLSEKADTYSYGVVLLEIISGQKSNEAMEHSTGEYLLKKAWKLYERDLHLELIDESINPEEYHAEEVKKVIEIALMCTQQSPSARPTMSEVVVLLKSKSSIQHQQQLMMPSFIDPKEKLLQDTATSASSSSAASNATASISHVSGR